MRFILVGLIIYDLKWNLIFMNVGFGDDKSEAWKSKSWIRNFSFFMYILNIGAKVEATYFYKFIGRFSVFAQ